MENSVIKEASEGNVKAFKKIFDYYVPKMRPVSARYARSNFGAEDVLQEAFVKIFHNLKNFKFEGSFEGWIRRIVVNTAINNYKKNKNQFNFEPLDDLNEFEAGWEEAEEIEQTESSEILKVINQLPEGYKLVFNLYVVEDLSHKEIAEMLGISEGTSRSQYSKSKKMILKLLSRQRNEGIRSLVDKNIHNEAS